jgi:predicted nucleotidyltransferase
METKTEIINMFKKTAKTFFPDCRILLFGSQARNEEDDRSDYDFLIITSKPTLDSEKMYYKAQIRKAMAKNKIAVDVFLHSDDEVEAKRKLPGHIISEIVREGVLI